MKTHKIRIGWLRHREAIIILFCALFVLFFGLMALEWIINTHPYLCLFVGVCFLSVFIAAKKLLNS